MYTLLDQCNLGTVNSYGMTTSCRGYWECDGLRTTVASCCGLNQRFVEGKGCIFDPTCNDDCPYKVNDFIKAGKIYTMCTEYDYISDENGIPGRRSSEIRPLANLP